eukprot:TRINITY_DN4836_c0_g1_i1.p1 TRINITY_DN4836_c0_g1~~TRINITY_DN4836_c0_g1_i1.p1  ORF type:complete len:593 (-),score=117.86 TRINITY_DN4836_c0_g1_i1:105-1883(-)
MASMDGFPSSASAASSLNLGSPLQPLASTATTAMLGAVVKSDPPLPLAHGSTDTITPNGTTPAAAGAPAASPKKMPLVWQNPGGAVKVATAPVATNPAAIAAKLGEPPKLNPALTVNAAPRVATLPLQSPLPTRPMAQLPQPLGINAKLGATAGLPLAATQAPAANTSRLLATAKLSSISLKTTTFSTAVPTGPVVKPQTSSDSTSSATAEDADASKKRKRDETPADTPKEAHLRKKLRAAVLADFGLTLLPDFERPFQDLDDAVDRLLGYHLLQEYDSYEGSYVVAVAAEKAEFPELEKSPFLPVEPPASSSSSSTATPGATTTTPTTGTATSSTAVVAAVPPPQSTTPAPPATQTLTPNPNLNSITMGKRTVETPAGFAAFERAWRSEYLRPQHNGKLRRQRDPDFPDDPDLMDVDSDEEGSFQEKIEASADKLLTRANEVMAQIPVRLGALFESTPWGIIPKEEFFLMQRLLYAEEHSELAAEKSEFEKSKKTEEPKRPAAPAARITANISPIQIRLAEMVRSEMTKRRNNPNQMKVLNSLLILANKADLPADQLAIVTQVVTKPGIMEALYAQAAGGFGPGGAKPPGR